MPTLTGDHQNRVTDYTSVAVYDTTQITSPLNYSNPKPGDACHPLAANQHPPLRVGNGQMCNITMAEISNALDCMHDQQAVLMGGKPPRRYIVRRLTPLECCRLQGFPDWWEDGVEGSDSARYKMWGNGIALPCAADVLRRIAKEVKQPRSKEEHHMHEHKSHISETLHNIEEAVSIAPAEKQEEVRLFLEGYLTALEQEIRKRKQQA